MQVFVVWHRILTTSFPYHACEAEAPLNLGLPAPRSLEGTGNCFPDPSALQGLLHLHSVAWKEGQLQEGWLAELAEQGLSLQKLELQSCNNIRGVGIGGMQMLKAVWIDGCANFCYVGLEIVCSLPLLESLRLTKYYWKLSVNGYTPLRSASRLRELWLCDCSQVLCHRNLV